MTTRNEWIAETAREYVVRFSVNGFGHALSFAKQDAALLESANVAPWQTQHPAPTASVESEVSAVAMIRRFLDHEGGYHFGAFMYDARAILARLDAKGGAK